MERSEGSGITNIKNKIYMENLDYCVVEASYFHSVLVLGIKMRWLKSFLCSVYVCIGTYTTQGAQPTSDNKTIGKSRKSRKWVMKRRALLVKSTRNLRVQSVRGFWKMQCSRRPCDHLFCKQCIIPWLAAERSCPVDRRTLEVTDLKPVARFFQNVLAKLMIKCDFEQQGCDKVVQLEQLQSHLLNCERDPNAEVVCDKGCNMIMKRREYEINDCLTHFSSRLAERDLEIVRLTALANCLQEENQHMNDELNRQRGENRQINDANRRLRLQINHGLLKWHRSENVTFTGGACDILGVGNKNLAGFANRTGLANPTGFANRTGFAQLFYSLESNFFFGVQILDWHSDSWMVIGLTRKHYPSCNPPGWSENSIGYSSYGTIQIDSKSEKVGVSWKNGNTIHCGIKFSENFDGESSNFDVMFLQNGRRIVKKRMEMPSDGLYPTICMWNCKVRYLTQ